MVRALQFLNSLAGRLRRYVGDRRRASRRGARFPARIPLAVSPLQAGQEFGGGQSDPHYSLAGATRDLSGRGLTLLLPAVRVGGHYLTDAGGYLGVRLETPGGPVYLLAAPTRFEHLTSGRDEYAFLLGARIVKMRDGDRAKYLAYLNTLARNERRAAERGRRIVDASAPALAEFTPTYVAEAFERFLRQERTR